MGILQNVLLGLVGLIALYILFRLVSMAIFKSWFEAKLQFIKTTFGIGIQEDEKGDLK